MVGGVCVEGGGRCGGTWRAAKGGVRSALAAVGEEGHGYQVVSLPLMVSGSIADVSDGLAELGGKCSGHNAAVLLHLSR